MQYQFTIYGRPVPASRPRVNFNQTCYTKTYEAWRKRAEFSVKIAARNLKAKAFPKGQALFLNLKFLFKPARKSDAHRWCIGRPDLDNLCKAVMDAMTGYFYAEDSNIVSLECQKIYGDWGDATAERIEVSLRPLEDRL